MTRRQNSTVVRRKCFDEHKRTDKVTGRIVLDCYLCGCTLDPGRDTWEAEHPTPHAWDGEEVLPVCVPCHRTKTKKDVKAIAKGKRVRDRNMGIKRPQNPMPFGRRSHLKKKITGEVVPRDEGD